MDRYPGVLQVLTLTLPPLEVVVSASDTVELAKIANYEMAELVLKYPDKFITAVACLPSNDIDAAIKEADRAITELNFKGVQIFSNINEEPLDELKFRPLYERMVQHDLPMWIHPWNSPKSVHKWVKPPFMGAIGWDFETSLAMLRLAYAGIFQDYSDIKFITHYCGGMVPTCERRFKTALGIRSEDVRKFYNDTALYGNTAGLMCGYAFFGVDRLLFGTDMPLGSTKLGGHGYTLETIDSIEQMDIPIIDRDKIFEGNARQLLRLTL